MRKSLLALLAVTALLPARAQLFGPESLGGALWGGLIGGIVGSDCRSGFSGEGAAIGAGVGLLAGAIVGESRRYHYYDSPGYAYYPSTSVSFGYGYGHCGSGVSANLHFSPAPYYAPTRYYQPTRYYRPARPNYALRGTLLGAASGALIGAGNNQPGEGAAIGAAAGMVLGSAAELAARRQERRIAADSTKSLPQSPAQLPPQAQQSNPSAQRDPANTTYYWITPRHQISDAPRVPDAPTF